MSEAIGGVIVYEAGRLHVCVDDGAAYESKSASLQIVGKGVTLGSSGRHLRHILPSIDLGRSAHELPDVRIKRTVLLLNLEKGLGIGDRRRDFQAVPDNPGILQ